MNKSTFFVLVVVLLCGCKSVQYVPVETTKIDSIYVSNVERDSIYLLDSVFVREKNDTIYLEKWRVKYVERLSRDTLWREIRDTISVPYPVERKLSKWESLKMKVGGYAMCSASVLVLLVFGWIFYKVRHP